MCSCAVIDERNSVERSADAAHDVQLTAAAVDADFVTSCCLDSTSQACTHSLIESIGEWQGLSH